MISYNNKDDFESMQQEAIRRVHEMQKKAESYINSSNNQFQKPQASTKNSDEQIQQNPHNNQKSTNQPNTNNHNGGVFFADNKSGTNKSSSSNPQKPSIAQDNSSKSKSNHQNGSNPYSQLFGSNLGGFNRYKNEANNHNKSNGIFPSEVTNSINKMLHDVSIDEEKLLILILIYILYKNGADMKLLIALGYLII